VLTGVLAVTSTPGSGPGGAGIARAETTRPTAATGTLRFLRGDHVGKSVGLDELVGSCGSQVVAVHDPYYGREKRYHAVPLRCVLRLGFGGLPDPGANLLLRARDGYTQPASGAQLAAPDGWLAFADADASEGDPGSGDFRPEWRRIDRRQLDPGPFYLVWSGEEHRDPHQTPWPYQLIEIELAPLADLYPHIAPPNGPSDSPARAGFAIFRRQCLSCHAVNGEGGTVGPDLNVPQSIVEYRPAEQIKAYVRNPQTFRYTSMPAHPGLSDADLDALVAYFEVMSRHKHDPGRGAE